eukprot:Polyplicarium_translucidae@DN3069_c0_g1_i3.p1
MAMQGYRARRVEGDSRRSKRRDCRSPEGWKCDLRRRVRLARSSQNPRGVSNCVWRGSSDLCSARLCVPQALFERRGPALPGDREDPVLRRVHQWQSSPGGSTPAVERDHSSRVPNISMECNAVEGVLAGPQCCIDTPLQTTRRDSSRGDRNGGPPPDGGVVPWTLWIDPPKMGSEFLLAERYEDLLQHMGVSSSPSDLDALLGSLRWIWAVPNVTIAAARQGVTPTWEDEAHATGCRCVVRSVPREHAPRCFAEVAGRLIVGEFRGSTSVTCISYHDRDKKRSNCLQLWLSAQPQAAELKTLQSEISCILERSTQPPLRQLSYKLLDNAVAASKERSLSARRTQCSPGAVQLCNVCSGAEDSDSRVSSRGVSSSSSGKQGQTSSPPLSARRQGRFVWVPKGQGGIAGDAASPPNTASPSEDWEEDGSLEGTASPPHSERSHTHERRCAGFYDGHGRPTRRSAPTDAAFDYFSAAMLSPCGAGLSGHRCTL